MSVRTKALGVQQLLASRLQVPLSQQGAAKVEGYLKAGSGCQLEGRRSLGQVCRAPCCDVGRRQIGSDLLHGPLHAHSWWNAGSATELQPLC